MEILFGGESATVFALACAITLFAGFVKGAVGFAMPLIMISAFGSFLPPELALAGLILPTLTTNINQAFRQGFRAAWETMITYRRFLISTVIMIVVSAQFVDLIPQPVFLLLLGVPITAFALAQLLGLPLAIPLVHRGRAEWALGAVGGAYGGIAGVWGPPLIVYLLSIGAAKVETVRVQGVVFLIGSAMLFLAHLNSGLMNAQTIPFSLSLCVPAMLGMAIGFRVGGQMDQARFRWWTQALLLLTGLNLIRRALGF